MMQQKIVSLTEKNDPNKTEYFTRWRIAHNTNSDMSWEDKIKEREALLDLTTISKKTLQILSKTLYVFHNSVIKRMKKEKNISGYLWEIGVKALEPDLNYFRLLNKKEEFSQEILEMVGVVYLEEAMKMDEGWASQVLDSLGYLCSERRDVIQAEKLYRESLAKSGDTLTCYHLGMLFFKQHRYKEAYDQLYLTRNRKVFDDNRNITLLNSAKRLANIQDT